MSARCFQENFSIQVRRYSKCQSQVHSAGVALNRNVEKFLDFRKSNNLIKAANDFRSENFSIQVRRYSKCQSQVHSAGVALNRNVEKFLDFRKSNNLIKAANDFRFAHAQDGAMEINVFSPGKFRMKSTADLEQAAQSSAKGNGADRRIRHFGNDL